MLLSPFIPDGYIIGNYLHASEQDIRDFFWTGSGDGPAALNPFDRFPISEDAIIKTATVVATVYIDRSNEGGGGGHGPGDDLCIFDCPPGGGDGLDGTIDNVTPTDRRFWLMTVVGGLFGRKDYPELEGKLARLYRVAFTRQQALHLGINNNTLHGGRQSSSSSSLASARTMKLLAKRRAKRRASYDGAVGLRISDGHRQAVNDVSRGGGRNVLVNEHVQTYEQQFRRRRRRKKLHKRDADDDGSSGEEDEDDGQKVVVVSESGLKEDRDEHMQQLQRTPGDGDDAPRNQQDITVDQNAGGTGPLTRNYDKDAYSSSGKRRVRILIHNTSHLRDDDDNDEDLPASMTVDSPRSNQLLNQTEIIYSVFVGGQPVLATTAAEDMKLMSQEEVEHVMEAMVYLKADPYLKEPQATPLIPSTYNGNSSNVIALIGQNPTLFVVSCVAAALFLVLLIGIFLVARGKRKHVTELKKLESTQALVMPGSSGGDDLNTVRSESGSSHASPLTRDPSAVSVIGSVPTTQKPSPTIHFPLPPMSRPTSSSSYSSDSSVYYPKRKLKHHTQELLDERAVTLTNKLQKQFGSLAGAENVYASVQKPKKEHPHKRRRKYLGENRVGSFEGAMLHAPGSPITSSETQSGSGSSEQSYDPQAVAKSPPYQHNETYNTDVIMKHYLKKKVQHGHYNAGFTMEQQQHAGPIEAFNKDKIRCMEMGGRASVDTGSIGSYLSMASVKSFPRCFVPEPLSRVLEPVTMTHLDQSEGGYGDKSTAPGTASTSQYNTDTEAHLSRSQSDGADPGVVGPIVWQMHKKEMEEMTSPLRDPVVTRNRFEGLLEGAIQLYSEPADKEEANKHSIPLPGVIRPPVETRGKSAAVVRESSRACSATVRPVTAAGQAVRNKLESSGPPSPGRGAWGSGAHSPLVRPMSAGPFHTPLAPQIDITRVVAPRTVLQSTELSTAPLLQNIMHELKRFRNE
ncbi:conserved hypothetical protein [Culex quinquefasciatus]|uniref:Uncharacterized protein n=1 Tax=Culex quinquefasciatus TaxID=7176 RepID=B0W6V7_CULQU|nr:conserved hypothetical protein [Culex quinquefasciatus]|eukprot:XP_001844441.1 conserved hypothetical protein [Culex quinquefasciatus]